METHVKQHSDFEHVSSCRLRPPIRAQCLFEWYSSSRNLDATITDMRSRRCMLFEVRRKVIMRCLRRWRYNRPTTTQQSLQPPYFMMRFRYAEADRWHVPASNSASLLTRPRRSLHSMVLSRRVPRTPTTPSCEAASCIIARLN